MTPIDNSDLAWLIVSDYNQDNNIGFPDELREDIYDPAINDWDYLFPYHYCAEQIFTSGEASGVTSNVGGFATYSYSVGGNYNIGRVGTRFEENCYGDIVMVGGNTSTRDGMPSLLVGGNRHGPR